MLSINPNNRPSAKEALNHMWFKCDQAIIQNLLAANENIIKRT